MTPRCFWDREGYLYERHPEIEGLARVVFAPGRDADWPAECWVPYQPVQVFQLYGPLIDAA